MHVLHWRCMSTVHDVDEASGMGSGESLRALRPMAGPVISTLGRRLWELTLEQKGHADAAEFIRWHWRHGHSLSAGADALGISRRQVAYYATGDEPVPRYILLACKGCEAQHDDAL
jgi:hypothetical protein